MAWSAPSNEELAQLLRETKSVAIVGASANTNRAAYAIADYLLRHSNYQVYLVNPAVPEILGQQTFATLADLPETPDLVDVFRNAEAVPAVVEEAINIGAKSIWIQTGIINFEAANSAADAGLTTVMDECIMVRHRQLIGAQ